jgi:hypothetical protein
MQTKTFLHQLAAIIVNEHAHRLQDIIIILPNKRARVFLIKELQHQLKATHFAPQIISIEDFIQDIAGIQSIDSIELLFEFYEVYRSLTPIQPEPFELFANWAKTLLQDFNEIDRYLLEPNKILRYLEDIKEIEHWALRVENHTELIEKHLAFWRKLPDYYQALYQHLIAKKRGYQGLIYREAKEKLDQFSNSLEQQFFLFAGFNALNKAEEVIVQHLLELDKAKVYWDIDRQFLEDPLHDAGLFVRRFQKEWPYYKTNPLQWVQNEFAQSKNIKVIGTSKSIGQAKLVGTILEEQLIANPASNLQHCAVVLGEESLLLPILYNLPAEIPSLNITMGYSSKNNPAQILVSKWFKMHTNARSRNASSYVFYYKEVLDILTHPLIEPYAQAQHLVHRIRSNNFTFIPQKRLFEMMGESAPLFHLLFEKWDNQPQLILQQLSDLLLEVKKQLNYDNTEEKISNAFLYSVFKICNKLTNYYQNHSVDNTPETVYALYKQIIDLAEVSFEGEPLEGLQIMGVLESRVLDFETVIITSVNEGKFPSGKSGNSFIPYDVKREYGLPTFKEKDAIYTYHFYHLLQRAKNIYLIYNADSEGLDANERSRFITQLEVEKQPNHSLTFETYHPNVPEMAYEPIVVPKDEAVLAQLKEIATQKYFSPSSLTNYIRNPIQFYFQRLLRISEAEEVEENIAVNTLGTIIHAVLEVLYTPFIGRIVTEQDIENCFSKIDKIVIEKFKEVYKEGEIKKGRNLLAFEVAKRNVYNFLKLEQETLKQGDVVQIVALEQGFEREFVHPQLPFPIKIGGNVDRIELRNGRVRIIDYKTGKVEARSVTLSTWDGLTEDIKNDKIIQLLAYAFLYEEHAKGQPVEVGIISFKNLKAGFLPFTFKDNKELQTEVTPELLSAYLNELATLLAEIMNPEVPFSEKVN